MAWNITGNIGRGRGASNRTFVKPALAISQRFSIMVATTKPALMVRHIVALRIPVKPSLFITQKAQGTALSKIFPALKISNIIAARIPTKPAIDLVQIKYDLVQTKGANAQVNTGTAWTNPANVTSKHNASNATIVGSATAAIDGTLTLDYADTLAKTDLTIQSVVLNYYVSHTSALAISTMTLSWKKGGGATTLQTITATTDALTTPRSFDITANITSWADLDALQTIIRWQSPVTTGVNDSAAIDAVELIITATKTDNI